MLDFKCQMIIDEFDERRPLLQKIRELVNSAIQEALTENDVEVTAVEGRIKKRDSLIGKLIRKGHKYHTLDDITDLVGFRVITLYSDDVDRVASYMERMFDVDWNESIDKRKMHEMSSFGYNSLHYICRIPKTLYTDEQQPELNTIRFEVQMRSTLQHVWAAMEHDLGYKSEIETPPEYMRMYGRLAGMLELADEEFARIRISIAAYRRKHTNARPADLPALPADDASAEPAPRPSTPSTPAKSDAAPADSGSRPDRPADRPAPQRQSRPEHTQPDHSEDDSERPIFRIQLFVVDRQLKKSDARFKGLSPVDFYREGGMYKYTYGSTPDYNEIKRLRTTIAKKFPDAFIVAFAGGTRVNLSDAIRQSRSKR